jgi:DNA-binding NtrC family response regulator
MSGLSVLVVEDDPDFRASVAALVAREDYTVHEAGSLAGARQAIAEAVPDVVLLDIGLPDGDGLELLSEEIDRTDFECVVMTGDVAVETAIAALREGALDYLPKPLDRTRLHTILTNVARTRGLKHQLNSLRGELRDLGRFGSLVGRSKPMQAIYDLISRVGPTDSGVFVSGESGTGKELVAETVHRLSRRKDAPFLALNCGAMSATLVESELFGHEKGSFTGADRRRQGYFERASGGTLFLDEITEMPMELQVKLLRVLETGSLTRVGATSPIDVDVRIITATNRDPKEAVGKGVLREDLFYRLNVFPIALPPLRDRGDDVELLARYFLDGVNERDGTQKRLSDAALEALSAFDWPGNVRELKNTIERAAILAGDVIGPDHLGRPRSEPGVTSEGSVLEIHVGSSIADAERRLILATLEDMDQDKKRAARTLGISLKTLYNRLNVYEASGAVRSSDD